MAYTGVTNTHGHSPQPTVGTEGLTPLSANKKCCLLIFYLRTSLMCTYMAILPVPVVIFRL